MTCSKIVIVSSSIGSGTLSNTTVESTEKLVIMGSMLMSLLAGLADGISVVFVVGLLVSTLITCIEVGDCDTGTSVGTTEGLAVTGDADGARLEDPVVGT